jgi:ketosteroid isomerase-like protein
MKNYVLIILLLSLFSCEHKVSTKKNEPSTKTDSLELIKMISQREKAMINKDIKTAMSQFSEDVTWINSQGYYFEGKNEVLKFHNMLAENDSLDYYYKAGIPKVRIINQDNALAYYSWKMFWYKKENPKDTINKEIGLMTLTAKKYDTIWKWIAITNQHTPWFYEEIEPVSIDD